MRQHAQGLKFLNSGTRVHSHAWTWPQVLTRVRDPQQGQNKSTRPTQQRNLSSESHSHGGLNFENITLDRHLVKV